MYVNFAGGSRFIYKACFCTKCHVRDYNKIAPEVMECMGSISLDCFKKTDRLAPKGEICSEKKPTFLSKFEYVLETFEGNGIPERLNALLSSPEDR